ncbi:hypothetical protein MNBD_PLANCTO03-2170 [hydrothermal vent metagenome]|uniref:Dockerin domain-containing protein n=1 Tax=hydrothermal vent metagenome TaxID=652676 RepID=A0A3B1DL76_9ZZZZ
MTPTPPTMRRRLIPGLAVLALAGTAAMGQLSYDWTGLGDGVTFSDPLNWLPNGVPGLLDEAKFDAAGSQTVNFLTSPTNTTASIENDTVLFNLAGQVYTVEELVVGDRLTDIGLLTVNGGSIATTTGLVQIGRKFPATGTLLLTGNAALTSQRDILVGDAGFGTFQLDAGSTVNCLNAFLADKADSTGEAHIQGTWTIASSLVIGNLGTASLTIENGGTVTVGSATKVGDELLSSGSLMIDGPGSTLAVTGSTTIGNFGQGSLTVSNGGLLSTAGFKIADDFASGALIDNASIIDTLGTSVGNRAAGTLTLANGASLQSPLVSVVTLGTLEGSGTITGALANEGYTNPGNGTGILTVTDNFTQTLGTLNIELGGTNLGTDYDQLAIGGTATLGGTLNVSLINGFNPTDGEFVILQGGTIVGTFVVANLPPDFTITYEADRVLLSIGNTCVADFNGDGFVNTQDVLAFLGAFVAGDPSADVNGDGTVNTLDFIMYLGLWNARC